MGNTQHRSFLRAGIGVSSTDFKVATGDARGGLFAMEHTNRKKGGVPRHLHHNEDEWFYVIEGDYIAEVGGEPANKMEEYFQTFKARAGAYSRWDNPQDKEISHAHGIELLGPPLSLE